MKAIKGLFFDLDGTLVDTLEADFRAYRKSLRTVGRKLDHDMYNSIVGLRADTFLKKLFPDITSTEIKSIREFKAFVYPDFLHLIKPNHHLINFVKTQRTGFTTVLLTTAQKVNADAVLKASNIENMFDHIITGDMVKHAKPHPEVYLKALEVSGLEPDEVIAFEDSEPGIAAALAASIRVLRIKPWNQNED